MAVREFRVASVQVNFSLVDQRALDSGLLAACGEHARVGVIARTPLAFGFLTGKYDGGSTFDPSDHRNRWSVEQRQLWADAMRAFVAQLGGQAAQTPAQAALRFCLSHAAVSSAIPGMLTAREVEENAAASDLGVLPEAERAGLCEAYRGREFFVQR